MTKKGHKSHHYIPQCYLKKFSENDIFLHTYNKENFKSYPQAIDKICCVNDFYTLPASNSSSESLYLECEYFANEVEPKYNMLLNKILLKQNEWESRQSNILEIFSLEEKREFARYIVIQWFRTPQMRSIIKETNDSVLPKMLRIFKEGLAIELNKPELRDLNIGYKIDPVIEHASHSFYNDKVIINFANALFKNYWEFFVSDSENIYTSDFPIVVQSHVTNSIQQYQGLASYGSELSFPISKNIVLTIWDYQYFKDRKQRDCRFSPLSKEGVRKYNWMRYIYANKYIYSYSKDFEIIDFLRFIGQ